MKVFKGWVLLVLVLMFVACSSSLAPGKEHGVSAKAKQIHQQAIVIDAHSDTPLRLMEKDFDLGQRQSQGQIDIPRMIEGGLDAQVFAIFVSPSFLPYNAMKHALDMIDVMNKTLKRYPDKMELALTAKDLERIVADHKIAIIYSIEGGHTLQNDLMALSIFYELGVRMMTLTWMNTNGWADAAGDTARWGGLNQLGVQIVEEMNRLGMVVDVSHVADETFWDVLKVTTQPVIASHSCCRELCNQFRNLSDDMLRAIAKNGGVVGINFYVGFLDQRYNEAYDQVTKKLEPELTALKAKYPERNDAYNNERHALYRKYRQDIPKITIDRLIDHIDHAVKIAGIDHVGLGSDFDGVSALPIGLEDVSKLPNITQKLVERGYTEEQIKKILGGNFLRVFRQVLKN